MAQFFRAYSRSFLITYPNRTNFRMFDMFDIPIDYYKTSSYNPHLYKVVSLMFGLIYFRLKYDQQGVMDINGFIFLCICNNGFSTMFFIVNVFPIELPIFYRDHENGMYRVFSYFIAKIITDVTKSSFIEYNILYDKLILCY